MAAKVMINKIINSESAHGIVYHVLFYLLYTSVAEKSQHARSLLTQMIRVEGARSL